jgi:hypothetical protein
VAERHLSGGLEGICVKEFRVGDEVTVEELGDGVVVGWVHNKNRYRIRIEAKAYLCPPWALSRGRKKGVGEETMADLHYIRTYAHQIGMMDKKNSACVVYARRMVELASRVEARLTQHQKKGGEDVRHHEE